MGNQFVLSICVPWALTNWPDWLQTEYFWWGLHTRRIYICPPGKILSNVANTYIHIYMNSFPVLTFQCLCVRHAAWHPSFSPLYHLLDHTNLLFSERIWHPLPTTLAHQPLTHHPPWPTIPTQNRFLGKFPYSKSVWHFSCLAICAIMCHMYLLSPIQLWKSESMPLKS